MTDEEIQHYTWYCPDCGSCGEVGCCFSDCKKCRESTDHMWDTRLEENQPKAPVDEIWYEITEDGDVVEVKK